MNDETKQKINEEIEKINLRLAAETEKLQRIVAESRLKFYITVFSALGAIIAFGLPAFISIIISSQNRAEFDRLEQKIQSQSVQLSQSLDQKGHDLDSRLTEATYLMSSEVRKTLGDISRNQSKPPKFSAMSNNRPLEGQLILLSNTRPLATIVLVNVGEGTAKSIGITLYCSDSTFLDVLNNGNQQWIRQSFVDELSFKAQYKFQYHQSITLSPQETFSLELAMYEDMIEKTTDVMLKITYEQGLPKKIPFKLGFKK